MAVGPKNIQATQQNPTPFELASLAAILLAGTQPVESLDAALGGAMQLYKAAQHKLAPKQRDDDEAGQAIKDWLANQPRYRFTPQLPTDEVREYLKAPDPHGRLGALRNVSKGTTLKAKFLAYRADYGALRQSPEQSLEELERLYFREHTWVDGKLTYILLEAQLLRFRRWQLDIARIEALKRRGFPLQPLDVWVRLLVTSDNVGNSPESLKQNIINDIGLAEAERVSSEIINKLRSLTLTRRAKSMTLLPPN